MKFAFIFLLSVFSSIQFDKAEDPDETDPDHADPSKIWQPDGGITRDEWFRCRGMPCKKWERRQVQFMKMNSLFKAKDSIEENDEETKDTEFDQPKKMSDLAIQNAEEEGEDGCTWLTEKQIKSVIHQKKHGNGRRHKRKLSVNLFQRWPMPVPWKFDGTHTEKQKSLIRRALVHYEENTCIRFKELGPTERYKHAYILVSSSNRGCYSYIGKVTYKRAQILNLESGCLFSTVIGVAVHEIGHALGFFHEHQRSDRYKYIKVNFRNIRNNAKSNFHSGMTTTDLAYDFNSVMHYGALSFSVNGKPVITPKVKDGSLYLHNMGQRSELSFIDKKIINLSSYCYKKCANKPLTKPCQRKGYQDPNDCARCKCPPGFAGVYCDLIAGPKNAKCGGSFNLRDTITISSLNYPQQYPEDVECNWYFSVPKNHKIRISFGQPMYVLQSRTTCVHWVEIIGNKNLDSPGPRVCGYAKNIKVISEGNEMLVLFRSLYPIHHRLYVKGFKAFVEVIPKIVDVKTTTRLTTERTTMTRKTTTSVETTTQPPTTTTRRTTQPPTTTSRTTTTQPPTTTTRRTRQPPTTTSRTTTTQPPTTITRRTTNTQPTLFPEINIGVGSAFMFACSFEEGNHSPESCGITQSKNDELDWSVTNRATPTQQTGPLNAHSGDFYTFMEASGRRGRGDTAKLELPPLPRDGKYCIRFWYCMKGIHIETLAVYQQSWSNMNEIWIKRGDHGQDWKEANLTQHLKKDDKIVFEGTRGVAFLSDIGLDDIAVWLC